MTLVLSIDPAWTDHQPSGVALLEGEGDAWRCIALAPSYGQFIALAEGRSVDWTETPSGGVPDGGALLDSSSALAGGSAVDLVTIDMPVSTVKVTGRREADSAISREFGGRGCSTHSPSTVRPGVIGRALTQAFGDRGYPVATTTTPVGTSSVLMEVYPHTALLSLIGAEYRVPYKVSRAGRYWPKPHPSNGVAGWPGPGGTSSPHLERRSQGSNFRCLPVWFSMPSAPASSSDTRMHWMP